MLRILTVCFYCYIKSLRNFTLSEISKLSNTQNCVYREVIFILRGNIQ